MSFTFSNALAFAPELWLLLGAALAFALGRVRPRAEDETSVVGLCAVALALAGLLTQLRSTIVIFEGAFLVDGYARLLQAIVLVAAATCLLLTLADRTWTPAPDFAGFLLLATTAAMLIAGAGDLVSLALGVALLGTCLAVMAVAARPASTPAAGVSAFVASTLGAATIAYGFALLYGMTGETALAALARRLAHPSPRPVLTIALALMVAGFGVLAGVVPVQWGLQSIFQRAPLPVSAFAGAVAVPAALGALVRVLAALAPSGSAGSPLLAILAAATMTGASAAALGERSLRRLLAWLLVGQAGFALAAVVGIRQGGVAALLVFLASLAVGMLAATAAVIAYTHRVHSDRVADLSGMATYAPAPAAVFGLALASLSGIPPLAGFFGRLLVLQAAVDAGYPWLALVGVANTVLAALIALRLIRAAFLDPAVFDVHPVRPHRAQGVTLGLGALAVVAFGAFLGPLLGFATAGARALLP
jgi:NADH-quinone oxidoreductase subunit N